MYENGKIRPVEAILRKAGGQRIVIEGVNFTKLY
jgi:hypothetical protein